MSTLPDSLVRFRTELEDAIRRELEAPETGRSSGRGARVLRAVRRRPGRTTVAIAAVAGAAAAALFVGSPRESSPAFSLARAQAALTPPAGMILHAKWQTLRTSREFGCTVTLRPNEFWADLSMTQTNTGTVIVGDPKSYRLIETLWPSTDAPNRHSMACGRSTTTEIGGTRYDALMFVPPDKLRSVPARDELSGGLGGWDLIADLRRALAAGMAHHEGQTELDGRSVERIRVDFCPRRLKACSAPTHYWYVDSKTFRPVQWECPNNCMTFGWRFGLLHFEVVNRYETYEYLPRTAANLALTDIRAQHPDATGPPDEEDR